MKAPWQYILLRVTIIAFGLTAAAHAADPRLHFSTIAINGGLLGAPSGFVDNNGTILFRGLNTFFVGNAVGTQTLVGVGSLETGSGTTFTSVSVDAFRGVNNYEVTGRLGSGGTSIFLGNGPSWQLVATPGQQAPDLAAGVKFSSFASVSLNELGHVAFPAVLSGPGIDFTNNQAFYAKTSNGLHLIAQRGAPANGLPAGVTYALDLQPGPSVMPVLSANSDVSFISRLSGTGVDSTNDQALFLGPVTSPQPVLRKGDTLGAPLDDVRYSDLRIRVMNGAEAMLFSTKLTGAGVSSTNDDALVIRHANGTTTAIREGDPASGIDDFFYNGEFMPWAVNDSDQVAFSVQTANLSSIAGIALYAGPIDSPKLVGQFPGVLAVMMNAKGQLASWIAESNGNTSLHFYDPLLGDMIVARTTEQIDFGDGITRVINVIPGAVTDVLRSRTSLNDDGVLAFGPQFSSLSRSSFAGAFAVTIPEPAMIAVIPCIGLAGLAVRHRRN